MVARLLTERSEEGRVYLPSEITIHRIEEAIYC
jgi:hypothetical protein